MPATFDAELPRAGLMLPGDKRRDRDVRWIDPRHDDQWNHRVQKAFPAASIFHASNWAGVLCETYNYSPLYFSSCRYDSLIPLVEVDSWLTGKRGVSLPFSDSCPPLAKNVPAFRESWTNVLQTATQRKWRHVSLRGGGEFLPANTPSVSFFEHSLELHADPERQLRDFHPAARRAVRKALASPLDITFSRNGADVLAFYRLFCMTRKRHGAPPPPFRFFANIQRHILHPGLGTLVLARLHGTLVAGAMFFQFGGTAHLKFSASDTTYQSLRPNNFVLWKAMVYLQEHGVRLLHFGRTSLQNQGLRSFKLGWGAGESVLRYYTYDVAKQAFRTAVDQADRWHATLLRVLPAPLFRLIGRMVYRHIA